MGYPPPPTPNLPPLVKPRCDYCDEFWSFKVKQCATCGAKLYEQKTEKNPNWMVFPPVLIRW